MGLCVLSCAGRSPVLNLQRYRSAWMKRVLLTAVLLLGASSRTLPTWSIVAVDRKPGHTVIASAPSAHQRTFPDYPAKGLKHVQDIIIPGVGVAAAQANVDRTRRLQNLIATELKRGTDPARIIELLKTEDPQHPSRQYGIVDLKGRGAGHSGATNGK